MAQHVIQRVVFKFSDSQIELKYSGAGRFGIYFPSTYIYIFVLTKFYSFNMLAISFKSVVTS